MTEGCREERGTNTLTTPEGAALRAGRASPQCTHPTTSFSTATTLIYAIGAGITAAAGTRLALQWISLMALDCTHSDDRTLFVKAQPRYFCSLPP